MTNVVCQACKATNDARLCPRCTDQLTAALALLPALLADLRVTATRQARVGDVPLHVRSIPAEYALADQAQAAIPAALRSKHGRITLPANPLPVNLDAAELRRQAVRGILTWAVALKVTAGTIGRVCEAIADASNDLRHLEHAGAIHAKALDLVATIEATIDRREPDIYAGRCDAPDVRVDDTDGVLSPRTSSCGADLYAKFGQAKVDCPACGMSYDLADRKRWLVDQIPDVIAPTTAIANALTSLLSPVTPSMIRQMALRGEIAQRGTDRDGKSSLYRVGDILDVLEVRAERKTQKLARASRLDRV